LLVFRKNKIAKKNTVPEIFILINFILLQLVNSKN